MNAHRCNQCGRVAPAQGALKWFALDSPSDTAEVWAMGDEMNGPGDVEICSNECLRDWAAARIEAWEARTRR